MHVLSPAFVRMPWGPGFVLNRWLLLAALLALLAAGLFPEAAAHSDDCLVSLHAGPVHVHHFCE